MGSDNMIKSRISKDNDEYVEDDDDIEDEDEDTGEEDE
jgi:hypothetical protein